MIEVCKWKLGRTGEAFGPPCSIEGSFWIRDAALETWNFCPLCGKPISIDRSAPIKAGEPNDNG